MPTSFEGKVAVVTGAGGGIGEAVAHDLALNGARVLVVDVNGANAESVAHAIREQGREAVAFCADVSVLEQSQAVVERAGQLFGALHYAVNNAGISGRFDQLEGIDIDEWRKVIGVNLDGVCFGMKFQLPAIEKAGGGGAFQQKSESSYLATV